LSSWRYTEQNSCRPTFAVLGVHVSRNDTFFLTFMSWCCFPTLDSTINGLPICLFVQTILISHIYKLVFWMVVFKIKIGVTKIRPAPFPGGTQTHASKSKYC